MTSWHGASRWVLLAGGVVFAALGGRVLWVAWQHWEAAPTPLAVASLPPPVRNSLSDLQRSLPVVDLSGTPFTGELAGGQQPRHTSDTPVLLFVSTEGARRDVLVNGVLLGQSPYMGQIYCERGANIQVTLRAASGEERAFTRPCTPEIRVSD